MAEREGFEPPVRLRALRISSAVRSTTLPPLRAAPSRRIRLARQIGAAINMVDAHAQGWRAKRSNSHFSVRSNFLRNFLCFGPSSDSTIRWAFSMI
jgi:hypothetical protein